MADPIAAAFVTVAADTKPFIAQIEALRLLAAKPIVVPVTGLGGVKGTTTAAESMTRSLGGLQVSSKKAAQGMLSASSEANAARGALIGLSRITPVAVFGLGVIGTAAIAAGLAIKGSVNAAAALEQQLNIFQAVTGATGAEMAAVSAQAKALGGDLSLPATSANDAATAMTELAKAGLAVNDTLTASRGVMQLAAAANITAAQAATITATQLNAFGLAGSEATKITDLLAGASIAAQGEITDFAAAFQQVSAVSHQVGLSVEDTTGLLTELAKAGLRGADGGTSLRTTLLRLVPTTKQAAEYVKALGININEQIPIGEQITSVIEQYRVALLKLTPIQQQETLTQIFGQDAIRAASIIFTQEPLALNKLVAQVSEAGSGARLAEARMKGFAGSVEGLKSAAQTLGGTLGAVVLPALTSVVTTLSSITTTATDAAGALAKVGGVTVKPVVGALGGTDTLAQIGLAAGAGLGARFLLAKRTAAVANKEIVAGVAAVQKALVAQTITEAEAIVLWNRMGVSAAQAERMTQVAVMNTTVAMKESVLVQRQLAAAAVATSGTVVASSRRSATGILSANRGLTAGLGLSVAGGLIPGSVGSVAGAAGAGAILGSFLPIPGGTAIGAGAFAAIAAIREVQAAAAKERERVKSEWQKMSWEEQQTFLRINFPNLADKEASQFNVNDLLAGTKDNPQVQSAQRTVVSLSRELSRRKDLGLPLDDLQLQINQAKARVATLKREAEIVGGQTAEAWVAAQGGFQLPPLGKFDVETLRRLTGIEPLERVFQNLKPLDLKEWVLKLFPKVIVLPTPKLEMDWRVVADNKIALATLSGSTSEMVDAVNANLDIQLGALARAQRKAESGPRFAFGTGESFMKKFAAWLKQHTLDVKAYTEALKNANSALNQAIAAIQSSSYEITLATLQAEGTKTLADDIVSAAAAVKEAEANLARVQDTKPGPARDRLVKEATLELQRRRNILQGKKDQVAAESQQTKDEAGQKRKDAIALVAATAKAAIDMQNARLDYWEAIAKGTKGIKDDRKVALDRIALNQQEIASLRLKRDQLVKTAADYKLNHANITAEIQAIKTRNVLLRQGIKDLTKDSAAASGGGFSLQDLFKESLRQFQEFGSNVSSNPLTGGQVRGQFGGLVARAIISNPKNQKDLSLVGIDKNTGDAAEYMRKLYEYFTGQQAPSGKGTAVTPISVGRRTADIGRLLHRNVGHL